MQPRRILVTGSAGAVGRTVCRGLAERGHHVRGFDLRPSPTAHEQVIAGVGDAAALAGAMTGCDTLVHLAANPENADFLSDLLPNNIVGTYHALDAARATGLRRVVLASSVRAVAGVVKEGPITLADGAHTTDLYGFTKIANEAMAEVFAKQHQLSIICSRIGWFVRDAREAGLMRTEQARRGPTWVSPMFLSHDDCIRFHVAAVETEGVPFAILFAISDNNGMRRYDLGPSQQVIGYVPQDTWPHGVPVEFVADPATPARGG